jgi:8-oxo-dGTP diphosphatase
MDNVEFAISKLETDRINNISIINFIKNNKVLSVDIIGDSVLARGISDRRWVYISCRDKDELGELKTRLSIDDNNFAAIEDWMMPVLTEGREIIWDLSTVRYYLPEYVQLPHPGIKTIPLTENDSHTVFANSTYKEYISTEYAAERINKGISAGVYVDDKLVSWAIIQDDGAIGFLHTLEKYRKKGYAYAITLSMIEKLRSRNELPFAYAEASNKRSIALLLKLGFKENKTIHWFELH